MKINLLILVTLLLSFSMIGCDDIPADKDNITSGSIKISIDETYKPIMEEQIRIFLARNPNAKIIAEYKPEEDCIADFMKDTTRMIFITRRLTIEEKQACEANKIPVTRELELARDAVAFVVAKGAKTEYTETEMLNLFKGIGQQQLVFDHENSSTVRYIQDSVLKGAPISKNIFAAKGCEDILSYVQKNNNAIGAIGVSWVADLNDSSTEVFMKKVDVIGIHPNNDSLARFRKPYQAYIGLKEYPFTRELFFISKENWIGLGTGFANYLGKDGQLVFKKARLFPLQANVYIREVELN